MDTPPTGDRDAHPGVGGARTSAPDAAPSHRRLPRRLRSPAVPALVIVALLASACSLVDDEGDGSAGRSPTDVAATDIEPAFVAEADCFGFEPADAEQIRCGTVEVPLDHDAPDDGTIDLAVVIDETADTEGAEAPLLVLGGGPGEVVVEPYLTIPQLRQVFATDRATIIIDQRGVGSSDPALTCPELPALEVQESAAADIDAALEAMGACRERLVADGVDLGAYNHLANARDIEVVRRALGYDQLNVRGTSYGTQVALLAAEMFPESVRSVVLSSPLDPRSNWMQDVPAGFAQALDRLATACHEDAACTDQVGDLRAAIEETVDRLDEQPEEVSVQPPGGEATTVTYTPSRFIGALFTFFYDAQLTAMLPAVVDRAQDGDLAPLATIVALLEQQLEGAVTVGMQQSMLCTGEAGLLDPEAAVADVDDELIAGRWYPQTMIGEPAGEFCELWDVEQRYDPAEITLEAEVPTLVVTGGLDHVTRPQLGEQVHAALPISHLIEVPQAGHGPLEALSLPGPCGQSIVTDFLADPGTAPDAACAADFSLQLGAPLPPGLG